MLKRAALVLISLGAVSAFIQAPILTAAPPSPWRRNFCASSARGVPPISSKGHHGLRLSMKGHDTDEGHVEMMDRVLNKAASFEGPSSASAPSAWGPSVALALKPFTPKLAAMCQKLIALMASAWGFAIAKFSLLLAATSSFFASVKMRVTGKARWAKAELAKTAIDSKSSISLAATDANSAVFRTSSAILERAGSAKSIVLESASTARSIVLEGASTAKSAVLEGASTAKSVAVVTANKGYSAAVKTTRQIREAFIDAKNKFATKEHSPEVQKVADVVEEVKASAEVVTTGPNNTWLDINALPIPEQAKEQAQEAVKKAAAAAPVVGGAMLGLAALGVAAISVDLMDIGMAAVASVAIASSVSDVAIAERKREREKTKMELLAKESPETPAGSLEP